MRKRFILDQGVQRANKEQKRRIGK